MARKNYFYKPIWLYGLCLISLLLLAAIWLIHFHTSEKEPQIEIEPNNTYADTLIVVADIDYQPYSFYSANDLPSGYDIELIYLLANIMEKNIEIQLMPWVDAQAAIQSDEADILMGLDYNVNALSEYELSMPLDNDPFVAFGKQNFTDIEDFYNKRIATLKGSGSFTAFLTPYQLETQTQVYNSYSEAFQSVANNENDYAIAMYSVGRRAIANLGTNDIMAVGPTLAGNNLCIGTKKGNYTLHNKLNQAIIQLKREGEIDRLGEKWLGRYIEVITMKDLLIQNKTMFVILLSFILLFPLCIYCIFNKRLATSTAVQYELTKRMLAYQQLLAEATKGLYESICEINITKNCIEDETTCQYFEKQGISSQMSFDSILNYVAQSQVEPSFISTYLKTFSTENILKTYHAGQDCLTYEFMVRINETCYNWMRVTARIFCWQEDENVRMITYRVNIDDDKRKEHDLKEKGRIDALTGLYNKVTTSELIKSTLLLEPNRGYAFLILDIDNFKYINDSFGHAYGDTTISEFASTLKNSIIDIEDAFAGRIGGDEFSIFLPYESTSSLEKWVSQLVTSLDQTIHFNQKSCHISTSIGIALAPHHATTFETLYQKADIALYQTKNRGKNGYTLPL